MKDKNIISNVSFFLLIEAGDGDGGGGGDDDDGQDKEIIKKCLKEGEILVSAVVMSVTLSELQKRVFSSI